MNESNPYPKYSKRFYAWNFYSNCERMSHPEWWLQMSWLYLLLAEWQEQGETQ